MLVRSRYIEKFRPFFGLDLVKVITGIRRSGKSVLLQQIQDEIAERIDPNGVFVRINLEEEENARFLSKGVAHAHVSKILKKSKGRKVYVFLDEVHDMEDWEITVNSLRAKKNVDVYITGSNSKLLSGELASCLTGRYVDIQVSPFSFAEFCDAYGAGGLKDDDAAFRKYLAIGGMPFVSNLAFREDLAGTYLEDVFSSILLKDVARRGKIRDVDLLGRIVRYVMTEAGHTFSAASIVRYLKKENRRCTVDTVLNYLDLCEQAFLFARVKREDLIGRRILAVDEKFYVTDHGMRRALVGGDAMRDIDQMLENLVYFELLRRGWHVTIGRLRTKEVDFVAERNGEINYYQVAYLMPSKETREREFGALLEIPDNHPKFVLSLDPVDMSADGIKHLNIRDFLKHEPQ